MPNTNEATARMTLWQVTDSSLVESHDLDNSDVWDLLHSPASLFLSLDDAKAAVEQDFADRAEAFADEDEPVSPGVWTTDTDGSHTFTKAGGEAGVDLLFLVQQVQVR